MLIDLPNGWLPNERGMQHRRLGGGRGPQRLHRGIYLAHINFDHELGPLIVNDYPDFDQIAGDFDLDWFNCYGVVDHFRQLPVGMLDSDPRQLLVHLDRFVRAEQDPRWGWRWHKWGPYLGVHDIEGYEYLYDTPGVVAVYTYHVVEIRGGDPGGTETQD